MKRKKKTKERITRNYLIFLISVVFAVLGISFLFFKSPLSLDLIRNSITSHPSPTLSDHPGWKTYTSDIYSFKYPPNFEVNENITPGGKQLDLICKTDCENTSSFRGMYIDPLKNYHNLDEYKAGIPPYMTDIQDTTLDGKPALVTANPGTPGGGYCCSQLAYARDYGGIVYVVMFEFPGLEISKVSQFPRQKPDILSTLHFTR